ncbi:nitroreductase [Streptomyces dangxiongensis]|uniref:Putative NAD(P)H nitroreductase n=1 Tax=Streptomyces dangxiongensis TaxID=1442032 RepID=A0A3G2JFA3_9ACTN|nr:nitroreductase [Streptomyces dangxiongensis]AYN38367.1 nitroreductase [Streptomyces dangxiongensis]
MDVMTAVLTRRSEHHLVEPAPQDEEFAYLLRAAATAPDHGRLRPWRWILVRDEGRVALGRCFAEGCAGSGARRDEMEAKAPRAPLLATLVFSPVRDDTGHGGPVPEWEQLAATSAMTSSLILLLHARGFGSVWRTDSFTESGPVRRILGLRREERLLGWLYIGTPQRVGPSKRRVPEDVTDRISVFAPELMGT